MFKKVHYFQVFLILSSLCLTSLGVADSNIKRGLDWNGYPSPKPNEISLGNYRAVIIGNNQYLDEDGVWKNLETAVKDAEMVAELLQREYGFKDVVVLKNAKRRAILGELKKLSNRAEPNDNVLVYYAGHGHLEDDARRGYWIPTDAQGFDDLTFIRNSTIRDEINIIAEKTKHTLLLSDSCFSGALLRGGNRGPSDHELSQGYYIKVSNKKSVQVLAAGGKEYVDDNYRNSGHSPFTYFLLNELKHNTQQYVSLSEVATNIIKAVANNVDQTPETGVLAGAGDELGEFIFTRDSFIKNKIEVASENKTQQDIKVISKKESSTFLPGFRF